MSGGPGHAGERGSVIVGTPPPPEPVPAPSPVTPVSGKCCFHTPGPAPCFPSYGNSYTFLTKMDKQPNSKILKKI